MVIECTACHARFRLADEKLKPGGTKVRCSKCRHIFTVLPPVPEPAGQQEVDFDEFNMEPVPEPPSLAPATEEAAPPGDFTFGEEPPPGGEAPGAAPEAAGPAEFEFGAEEGAEPAFGGEETGEFAFGAGEEAAGLGEFDFGEEAAEPSAAATGAVSPGEFEIGETTEEGFPAGEQGEEGFAFGGQTEAGAPAEFEFGGFEGDEELAFGEESAFSWEEEPAGAEEAFAFGEPETPGEEPGEFDLGGLSFGEEEAPAAPPVREERPPISPERTTATVERTAIAMEPIYPPREARAAEPPAFRPEDVALPVAAPRKSPFSKVMAAVVLLLLVVAGAAAFFWWKGGIPDAARLIEKLTGQTPPAPVAGQIRLDGVASAYAANREAGRLLVIRGQAINDFPEPRAAITVKGTLFNKEGKALLQQTVFCGNPLDEAALSDLPFARIEEAMNHPFGAGLSNLNVPPGKGIPFTIVFRNLPPDVAEFTVEVIDSKPAAKQ